MCGIINDSLIVIMMLLCYYLLFCTFEVAIYEREGCVLHKDRNNSKDNGGYFHCKLLVSSHILGQFGAFGACFMRTLCSFFN